MGRRGERPARLTPLIAFDLDRGFSFGRDIAMWLRQAKATRAVPIVFVEGEPGKLDRLETQLPGATYTSRGRIRSAAQKALANPPAELKKAVRPGCL